jgi:hypothetical protein
MPPPEDDAVLPDSRLLVTLALPPRFRMPPPAISALLGSPVAALPDRVLFRTVSVPALLKMPPPTEKQNVEVGQATVVLLSFRTLLMTVSVPPYSGVTATINLGCPRDRRAHPRPRRGHRARPRRPAPLRAHHQHRLRRARHRQAARSPRHTARSRQGDAPQRATTQSQPRSRLRRRNPQRRVRPLTPSDVSNAEQLGPPWRRPVCLETVGPSDGGNPGFHRRTRSQTGPQSRPRRPPHRPRIAGRRAPWPPGTPPANRDIDGLRAAAPARERRPDPSAAPL